MQTTNLAEMYQLPAMDWTTVRARLEQGVTQAPGTGGPNRHTCWLTTLNPDGSPHVTGIGALWAEGSFWFETGRTTRKGRNLERDPRCAMAVSTLEFDLVVDGEALMVSDSSTVATMAARWAEQGWPAGVDETGLALTADYSAPSAGPPPWSGYRLTLRTAAALSTLPPGGATRWQF